jgi:signal transduction histidine kinase
VKRSLRWHLLLNGLFVSLVAIVSVSVITLLLVEAYFSQQEEQYLRERSADLVPNLESAFDEGINHHELQQIAGFGLFTGRVRIRVMDRFNRLLVDSGSFEEMAAGAFLAGQREPFAAYEFYLDAQGRLQGFGFPQRESFGFEPFGSGRNLEPDGALPRATIEPAPSQPLTEISDVALTLPLRVDNQVVGYAELSEGPAFGQIIRKSIQRSLIIGGLVALIFAAGAAVLFARQVIGPLRSLGNAADEMAQGNLDARAKPSKISEIDQLSNQFNDMAGQLAATIDSLEKDRASLHRFIADASHELRTPLTALITFNTLLARNPAIAREPVATFVSESDKQLILLDRLTTDLLDLSRFEARLSGADFVLQDIRPPIERAITDLKPLSQAKNQQLELILPPEQIIVSHDPASLERCLGNLIGNAIKQTPDGGRIQVSLKRDQDQVIVDVLDDGPGIPADEQSRIFDRFYRGSGAEGDGSGLGLAIAQEIASIHGGTISLISGEGQGSLFSLKLTVKQEQ